MKTPRNLLFLGFILLASFALVHGQSVFYLQDNFDHGLPYQDNTALPRQDTGDPYPVDGYWSQNVRNGGRSPWLSTDYAQSGTRSVALTISPNAANDQQSALTGFFSPGGGTENRIFPVDALRIRFAFYLTEGTSTVNLAVRTAGDLNVAVVNFGREQVSAQFNGGNQTIDEALLRNQWYFLEVDIPENPQISGNYTVRLLDEDGVTLRGAITGAILRTVAEDSGYSYFTIAHSALQGEEEKSIYLDTFSVQVIPEVETYGLILGVAGVLFWLTRRRVRG